MQLSPPLHLLTPLGDGFAHFLEDGERGVEWQVFICRTGESWWFRNHQVRLVNNITLGVGPVSAFEGLSPELAAQVERYRTNGWLR